MTGCADPNNSSLDLKRQLLFFYSGFEGDKQQVRMPDNVKKFEQSDGRKWRRRVWLAFLTIVTSAIAGSAAGQTNDRNNDVTGTVSKAVPAVKQDGTSTHPYADESQCSPKTDLVFWLRNDRAIPSIPPGISVCFVGDKSSNDSGPSLEVRGR